MGKGVTRIGREDASADESGLAHDERPVEIKENRKALNKTIAAYKVMSDVRLYPTGIEKTPKKRIKRYLYMNNFQRK